MRRPKDLILKTTTDIKVFLLFLLDNIARPIDHTTLMKIVEENTDEIAFDYPECLNQLVASDHLLFDEYEDEKGESIGKIIVDIRDYIVSDCGIQNPDIIPTSALLADIFKKVLRNEKLTRTECRKFKQYFALYSPTGANLSAYAITKGHPNPCENVEVSGEMYRVADIIEALNNTGIPYLERYIQTAQIASERLEK